MNKSQWQVTPGFVTGLLICILLFLCLYNFLLPRLVNGGPAKAPLARNYEKQLFLSIKVYKEAFGSYPTGENSNIVRVLAGDNPQKLELFHFAVNSTNKNGEIVDPWKIPYKFVFDGTNSFTILSAGIDQKFGDADDIIFNSVSNGF
jgi:hypothetical protein